MRGVLITSVVAALSLLVPGGVAAQDSDIEELRAAVEALRSDYEARIAELEQRLAVAEQNAAQSLNAAAPVADPAATQLSQNRADAAFNPAIGVVFQGFLNGVEGPAGEEEGFAVGETELIMSANVDDKFAAYLTAALAFEDGVWTGAADPRVATSAATSV